MNKINNILKLIFLGLCFYNIAFVFLYDKIYPEESDFIGIVEIQSIVEEKEFVNKYIVKVKENKNIETFEKKDYTLNSDISKNTKLIIYCSKKDYLYPGSIIKINGKFAKADENRNYKGFNYREYLKQFKIYGIIYVDEIEKIDNTININSIIQNIRLNILNKIENMYENNNNKLLSALLIGKTDQIDEDIKEEFRNSNISHILAISGLHISYFIMAINLFFPFIIKNKNIKNFFIIIFLMLYVLITGFSISCLRVCIMQSIFIFSTITHKKYNFYRSFIFTLFIIIIIMINPFYFFNIGMCLSFLGTLGIVLFYKFFFRILKIYLKNIKLKKIYLYFFKIILVTLSAQILIIPIMIYEFNLISISFLISNFFISFLIGPILVLGYISIFFYYIKFPLYKILVKIENLFIYCILKIGEIFGKEEFTFYIKTPNIVLIFLYYILIFFIINNFNNRKYYYLKYIISKKYLREKKIRKIVIVLIILIIIINNFNITNFKLEICFLDVGQGDCTLIKTPKGKCILIDGGEGGEEKYDYGKNIVIPYLLDKKINKIDYIIISHFDSDHVRTDY